MQDVVAIAQANQSRLRAEIRKIDQFIAMAQHLLKMGEQDAFAGQLDNGDLNVAGGAHRNVDPHRVSERDSITASEHADAVEWPRDLAWVIRQLRHDQKHDRDAFQPDAGLPTTRAGSGPYPILIGEVTLNDAEWMAFSRLIESNPINIYRIIDPGTEQPCLAAIVDKPFERRISTVNGATTRQVDLTLLLL